MQLPRAHLFAIACLLVGRPVLAQVQTRIAVDGSVGMSRSVGSGVTHPDGLAADAAVALRFRASRGHSSVIALSTARLGPIGDQALICPTPDTCPTRAGRFRANGVLVGWEFLHGTGASVRGLVGQGWLRSKAAHNARSGAILARVDVSTPAAGPLALVGSVQGARHRPTGGSAQELWAATAGVRLR